MYENKYANSPGMGQQLNSVTNCEAPRGMGQQLRGADCVVPSEGRLNIPAMQLEQMGEGFHQIHMRLMNVSDRLMGPMPVADAKEANRANQPGVAGRYELIADCYATLLRRISQVVDQLEQV
jgi:hypothetical protein